MRVRLGFKGHFLSNSFHSSVPRCLIKQLFKNVKCHLRWGRSEKCPKSVTYYSNGPLGWPFNSRDCLFVQWFFIFYFLQHTHFRRGKRPECVHVNMYFAVFIGWFYHKFNTSLFFCILGEILCCSCCYYSCFHERVSPICSPAFKSNDFNQLLI